VYDYVDGKADWMAYGLPVEGDDGPFVGELVEPVPTCDVEATLGEVRAALEASDADVVVVVADGGLAVGEVGAETIEGRDDAEPVLDVMDPVPSTIRPSVTVASIAESGGGRRLVTTSDGRLLGQVTIEHHHHHGDEEAERYERELDQILAAVAERFGDREPSDEELRRFLHERLVGEGRSPEDADRFLDEMGQ
jgi:CBS domain-containing protein